MALPLAPPTSTPPPSPVSSHDVPLRLAEHIGDESGSATGRAGALAATGDGDRRRRPRDGHAHGRAGRPGHGQPDGRPGRWLRPLRVPFAGRRARRRRPQRDARHGRRPAAVPLAAGLRPGAGRQPGHRPAGAAEAGVRHRERRLPSAPRGAGRRAPPVGLLRRRAAQYGGPRVADARGQGRPLWADGAAECDPDDGPGPEHISARCAAPPGRHPARPPPSRPPAYLPPLPSESPPHP